MPGMPGADAEHERLLAAIGNALGDPEPYPEFPKPAGASGRPGRTVLAGTAEEGSGRVARVEETVEAPRDGYLPVEITVNVIGDGGPALRVDLYTYNPYFGCDVHLIRFVGDVLVLVYTEKHGPLVNWISTATGEQRITGVGDDFVLGADLVVHSSIFEDLLHHIGLRDQGPAVPLPLPPVSGRARRTDLEIERRSDGTVVRWTDGVPLERTSDGTRPWQVRRTMRLRLPSEAQRGFPEDRQAFWARLRDLLDDTNPPADGADVLIATAGLPFWLPRPGLEGGRKGYGPAIWWFAAAYHNFLLARAEAGGADRPGEAAQWSSWLQRLGAEAENVPEGWDPTWAPAEGAARLALAHIRIRAAQLARACQERSLPDYPFWFGWSRRGWEHPVPLADFPAGFVRAWGRVPGTFFPG